MLRHRHPFDRCGLASLADFETSEWNELFATLERYQRNFLSHERQFRGADYPWPRDPLHTWSRAWEYPFVFHHLQQWRRETGRTERPTVVDLGCGVTFMPFAVADLDCRVICADVDPIVERDLQRASEALGRTGQLNHLRVHDGLLDLPDDSVDAVYCISVLEHIEPPDQLIDEIARILAPDGRLILTIDLGITGASPIGPAPHQELVRKLADRFHATLPDISIHPQQILTSRKGPYPMFRHSALWKRAARRLLGPILPERYRPELACQAFVLRKGTVGVPSREQPSRACA